MSAIVPQLGDKQIQQFEYDQVMRSYHEYFKVVAKGITIYLLIIGACLTLPNTVQLGSPERLGVFREACRLFAMFISVVALAAYGAGSVGFWALHWRAAQLASSLQLASPTTWVLPVSVWLACAAAVIVLMLVTRYS